MQLHNHFSSTHAPIAADSPYQIDQNSPSRVRRKFPSFEIPYDSSSPICSLSRPKLRRPSLQELLLRKMNDPVQHGNRQSKQPSPNSPHDQTWHQQPTKVKKQEAQISTPTNLIRPRSSQRRITTNHALPPLPPLRRPSPFAVQHPRRHSWASNPTIHSPR